MFSTIHQCLLGICNRIINIINMYQVSYNIRDFKQFHAYVNSIVFQLQHWKDVALLGDNIIYKWLCWGEQFVQNLGPQNYTWKVCLCIIKLNYNVIPTTKPIHGEVTIEILFKPYKEKHRVLLIQEIEIFFYKFWNYYSLGEIIHQYHMYNRVGEKSK